MRGSVAVLLLCTAGIAGCVEPGYRYEVHDTGEGSIRIDHVAKTPPPAVAASAASPSAAPVAQTPSDQQRIADLEARVRSLDAENQKLKQATTAPAKE